MLSSHSFRLKVTAYSTSVLTFSENKAEYSALDASRRRLRQSVTDLLTDGRTDEQTDGRTDGRTDGHILL